MQVQQTFGAVHHLQKEQGHAWDMPDPQQRRSKAPKCGTLKATHSPTL